MRRLLLGFGICFGFWILIFGFTTSVVGCGDTSSSTGSASVSSIALSPTSAIVEYASRESFSCIATYSDSTSAAIRPTWTVTGEIGTITSIGLNGMFTATTVGTGWVVATYNSLTASAEVQVTTTAEATATSLEVFPAYASLRVAGIQVFTAEATNVTGEVISFTPTWFISGDAIGILTSSGLYATFEATAEGEALIYCFSDAVTVSAFVTVEGYTVEITAETDTYVNSIASTESYGSLSTLIAGRISSPSEKRYEAYFWFDLSSISTSASIEAATLNLYATSVSGTLNLANVGESWTEAVIWDTRPTLESLSTTYSFVVGSNEVNVKDLVSGWVSGTNYGLVIYEDETDTGYVNLIAEDDTSVEWRRPKLSIEYK